MSKIEVDAITEQSGSTLTTGGGAGKTVVVDATTVTLGRCGGTVALASGASQTGFGRTGTVDWQTGSIKTATFTAANGEGYFANTSGGAFVMNLPAGTAGNIVSVVDYTNTFQTNNLTISPNGSEKIGGVNANSTLNTEGQSVTLVYVDNTEGWKNVQDSTSNVIGNENIIATGGTITQSGNFKIHTFTGPGTFTVSNISATPANNIVSYMVVAGGGAGGSSEGGGGGAGGFREYKGPADSYTASPLNGNPSGTAVTVAAQAYPIAVGGGGASVGPSPVTVGTAGVVSTFSTITSAGGSGGNAQCLTSAAGGSGGGSQRDQNNGTVVAGNTPSVTPPQGNPGGSTPAAGWYGAGGGGGATAVGGNGGGNGSPGGESGGPGGAGATTSITASPVAYAGGGGGSINGGSGNIGTGGTGGGGNGSQPPTCATAGTINRGGGGGGGTGKASGAGGSGIVVIRYKFQ